MGTNNDRPADKFDEIRNLIGQAKGKLEFAPMKVISTPDLRRVIGNSIERAKEVLREVEGQEIPDDFKGAETMIQQIASVDVDSFLADVHPDGMHLVMPRVMVKVRAEDDGPAKDGRVLCSFLVHMKNNKAFSTRGDITLREWEDLPTMREAEQLMGLGSKQAA